MSFQHLAIISIITASSLAASCGSSSSSDDDPILLDDPSNQAISSNFDDGMTDGWTISNSENTSEGDMASVSTDGNCGLVNVEPSAGYLCADAAEEGDTSYFRAPQQYSGDFNVFSSLNFRLVANGGSYFDSGFGFDGDIVISNGVEQASFTFPEDQRPSDTFTSYQILLDESENWITSDGSALAIILQSVSELRIRAEYGTGADNAGLDDVFLQ